MPAGVVTGGEPFVYAAYAISGVVLSVFVATMIYRAWREGVL
jgi:hypothetical protein